VDVERSVDYLIDKLQEYKKEYFEMKYNNLHIERDYDYDYNGSRDNYYMLKGTRLETDVEFNKRTNALEKIRLSKEKNKKRRKEREIEKELETYRKLHKKFNGKEI